MSLEEALSQLGNNLFDYDMALEECFEYELNSVFVETPFDDAYAAPVNIFDLDLKTELIMAFSA